MKRKKRNLKKLKNKKVQKICKNCMLYDPQQGICKTTILMEGEKINLPMYPDDPCFFEQEIIIKDENGNVIDRFTPEIQQVKMWCEDPKTGKKSDKGVVKIEYPKGFFGEEKN